MPIKDKRVVRTGQRPFEADTRQRRATGDIQDIMKLDSIFDVRYLILIIIKVKFISKTYDLILSGIAFLCLFFYTTSDSIDYFIGGKYFEGYMVVGMTIIFTIISIPILLLMVFRKNFRNLKIISLLVVLIFIVGFLGFNISLSTLPIIGFFGISYTITEMRFKIINND